MTDAIADIGHFESEKRHRLTRNFSGKFYFAVQIGHANKSRQLLFWYEKVKEFSLKKISLW
jgi:hypothetical protein